jgi:hypothetical protein
MTSPPIDVAMTSAAAMLRLAVASPSSVRSPAGRPIPASQPASSPTTRTIARADHEGEHRDLGDDLQRLREHRIASR